VDLPHAAKHNLTARGNGPLAGSCKPWQGLTNTRDTASLFHEARNHLIGLLLITEYSFRAKPMMIDYSDSERREDLITCFGFLIEVVAVDSAPTMTACPRLQGYSGRKTQISWR